MGEVANRLIADVGAVPSRWVSLIRRLDDLPGSHFDAAVEALTDIANSDLHQSDGESLAEALRRLVSHHAEYPEADWSLSEDKLERLKSILPLLEDSDPVRGTAWLFARDTRLPDLSGGGWRERVRLVEARRAEVVGAMSDQQGVDGLVALARAVEDPWSVGSAAANANLQVPELTLLAEILDSDDEAVRTMGQGFVARQTAKLGKPWVTELLASDATKTWTPAQRGSLLVDLPLGDDTWNLLRGEEPATQEEYWRRVPTIGRGQDVPADVVEATATNLQDHGRHAAAVDLIRLYGASNEAVANALELLAEKGPEDDYRIEDLAWAVTSLTDGLDVSPLVPAERIARIEWIFLGLRRYGEDRPRFLERSLATDPQLFVQMLELVFKPEGADEDEASPAEGSTPEQTQAQRQVAQRGSELLFRWSTPPGLTEEGTVDAESLRGWISESRERAAAVGRQSIADEHIGQILARLPEGSDGYHPHEAVRDLFEELKNGDIENGYYMGVLNARGITSRSLTEGGDQERLIESRLREASVAIRVRWPTASRILGDLAARYEHEARDEDVRAQLHEEGIWD
jgi:hypothetical protein